MSPDNPAYRDLPDLDLLALEQRFWNKLHNTAKDDLPAIREQWRTIIREIRRRDLFAQVRWR